MSSEPNRPPEPEPLPARHLRPHAPRFAGVHAARPGYASSLFLGGHGLRAGWACLLFLTLLFLVGYAVTRVLPLILHGQKTVRGGLISPLTMGVAESALLIAVLATTWIMARLEARPFLSFGLSGRAGAARFGGGLVCGFAAISALVGLLWSRGLLTLASAHLGSAQDISYALKWALCFLLVALFEETLLRGYLLFTLARGIGFWPAALLLSALFGFVHHTNSGESPVGLFSAACVGLLFCLSIWYTGSLWWAIGFHTAWDWGESFFWSTSNSGILVQGHLLTEHPRGASLLSGGVTGPEGSLWVFPVLLVSALFVFLWWRAETPLTFPAAGE